MAGPPASPIDAVTAPTATVEKTVAGFTRETGRVRCSSKADPPICHERHRVDATRPRVHLEVEVATGRGTGRTARRDVLTGTHPLAHAHEPAFIPNVRVARRDAAAVIDLDEVAVGAGVSRERHHAAVRRIDRRGASGADVDRVVEAARAAVTA